MSTGRFVERTSCPQESPDPISIYIRTPIFSYHHYRTVTVLHVVVLLGMAEGRF